MNFLGIDLGQKSCGLTYAKNINNIHKLINIYHEVNNFTNLIEKILNIITAYKIDKIIIGIPLNNNNFNNILDNTNLTYIQKYIYNFAKELKKVVYQDVVLVNENYSTKFSKQSFLKNKNLLFLKEYKNEIDLESSKFILQKFFLSNNNNQFIIQ